MRAEAQPNGEERRGCRAVAWTAALALVFVAGSFAAPLLVSAGNAWGAALHMVYSPLCHQMPERSLAIGAGTQAVCARCSGLYLGGAVGLWAAARLLRRGCLRPRPLWLAVAFAPSVVDFALPWLGLSGLANVPRLTLAIPAGAVAALFLAVGIEDLLSHARRIQFVNHDSSVLEEIDG